MGQVNNGYISMYVKRKQELFPLIEQHSGKVLKKATHGQAVSLYIDLLKNDTEFRNKVDALISQPYNNAIADWGIWDIFKKKTDTSAGTPNTGGGGSGTTVSGPFASIINTIGGVFGSVTDYKTAQENQDTVLYQAILDAQGGSDTKKILIASGIALVFVAAGAFILIKINKK